MTRGHGWSLTSTTWRTFTSYTLPAFTGAFYGSIKFCRRRLSIAGFRKQRLSPDEKTPFPEIHFPEMFFWCLPKI